ncbi:YlbG family protein [Streptococcus sp. SR1]|uniref:YlbG family protein n=1 Tax=Streptococcus sp. SR1 TaxID=1161416 RepID=UPI00044E9026|nr:YlbG family protein [Streptococcus sp. SR1]EUC79666.1 PF09902 family protein [Streptococcus sp. SR1]
MFEKVNRSGLIIYLYYNRDAKKLQEYGDICYHSKKHRYLQLYVPTEELDDLVERLGKERYIKKIRRCHIQELETPFVGNLYRNKENVII